jgi:hypothetical protein
LVAANAIYSKLESGSKANGQSMAWYGRKKKSRKDDELLHYLQQARHSDEHSVSISVTAFQSNVEMIAGETATFKIINSEGVSSLLKVKSTHDASTPSAGPNNAPLQFTLWSVTNRGVTYCPPKLHLCRDISKEKPVELAQIAIIHFEALLAEAATMADF